MYAELHSRSEQRLQLVLSVVAVGLVLVASVFPATLLMVIAAGLLSVAFFHVETFLAIMVVLIPWYPFLDTSLPVRDIFLILHLLLFPIVGHRLINEGKSITSWLWGSKVKKAILGFVALASFSVVVSFFPLNVDSIRALIRLYSYLALFYAIVGTVDTELQMSKILKLVFYSTIVVDLFGFYQALAGGYTTLYFSLYPLQESALDGWEGRITSLLFHYNALAGYLNLVFPFALSCAVLAKDGPTKRLGMACSLLTVPALLLTQSRGGVAAFAIVLIFGIWYLFERLVTRLKIFGAVGALATLAIPFVLHLVPRLQEADAFSAMTRLSVWSAAVMLFLDHPVLGVGYGNYRALYANYIPSAIPGKLDAHSIYFQMLAEMGIIGFVFFFALLIGLLVIFRTAMRDANHMAKIGAIGAAGAIVSVVVHGTVDYLFIVSPQFGGMFWMVVALGLSALAFSASRTTAEN